MVTRLIWISKKVWAEQAIGARAVRTVAVEADRFVALRPRLRPLGFGVSRLTVSVTEDGHRDGLSQSDGERGRTETLPGVSAGRSRLEPRGSSKASLAPFRRADRFCDARARAAEPALRGVG
jgi:hypothetical protein